MVWAGAIILVVCFVLLLRLLAVVENSRRAIATARASLGALRDAGRSDEEKEILLQRHAKDLFVLFLAITAGCTAALLVPVAVLWLLDMAGVVPLAEVLAFTLSWQFIAGSIVLVLPLWWLARRHAR